MTAVPPEDEAQKSADAIVSELEKVSEDAEKKETEARDSLEGTPSDAPEWFKKWAKSLRGPQQQSGGNVRDGGVVIYTSSKAREDREGNIIREGHYRAENERLQERGEKFSHLDRGSMFAESDKETRARDAAGDAISGFRGWDDAGRHLTSKTRIGSVLKDVAKLVPLFAVVAVLAVVVFDRPLVSQLQYSIGPWLANYWNKVWLIGFVAALLLLLLVVLRYRKAL